MGRMLAISMGLYGLFAPQFMLVFFAFFIYLGAAQEGAAALGRTLTHGIPVRAAMITRIPYAGHGDTVRDAANLLLSTSQQDFPVMHGDQVVGLLGRNLLLRALASEGPDAYVAGVMDRDFVVLEPDQDLAEVLPLMAQAGRCALVMDGSRLEGLLTTDNLSEFLLCAASAWSRWSKPPRARPSVSPGQPNRRQSKQTLFRRPSCIHVPGISCFGLRPSFGP